VFEQHSREWVIGDGIENVPTQESMAFERLEDFIRYVLFRLPPKMPLISQSKRLSKAATAWKNKVSLIEAISHVAQQEDNKKFASLILPILDELLESESKTEREALLVARTKIKRKHVGL
jgi:hypothetical protein